MLVTDWCPVLEVQVGNAYLHLRLYHVTRRLLAGSYSFLPYLEQGQVS
jgi:hypothetical protein